MMHYGHREYMACIPALPPNPMAADAENHCSQSVSQLNLMVDGFIEDVLPFSKPEESTISKMESQEEKSMPVNSLDFQNDQRQCYYSAKNILSDW